LEVTCQAEAQLGAMDKALDKVEVEGLVYDECEMTGSLG
jgi:hypothetical protein